MEKQEEIIKKKVVEQILANCKAADTKLAVDILCQALREDPEYYYSWQANIAMQFKDLFNYNSLSGSGLIGSRITKNVSINTPEEIDEIANNAAKNFLNHLIK